MLSLVLSLGAALIFSPAQVLVLVLSSALDTNANATAYPPTKENALPLRTRLI